MPDPTSTSIPAVLGGAIVLVFFARREQNGTYTLCLDAPSSDTLPIEIGTGYESVAQVADLLHQALIAPAVAEDRVAALEEYTPAMNETIDRVNEQTGVIDGIEDRLAAVESWMAEMQVQGPQNRPAVRPPIARPGKMPAAAPASLRKAPLGSPTAPIPGRYAEEEEQPQAARPVRRPATDAPRPDFNRGEFEPHRPVARVGRGPGSEG